MSIQTPESSVNIKDLVLDEPAPKKSGHFDPERDLGSFNWSGLLPHLEDISNPRLYHNKRSWQSSAQLLMSAKVLFPENFSQFHTDNALWEMIVHQLENLYTGNPTSEERFTTSVLNVMAIAALSFPERDVQQDFGVGFWDRVKMEQGRENTFRTRYTTTTEANQYVERLLLMATVYPVWFGNLHKDDSFLEELKKTMELAKNSSEIDAPGRFTSAALSARLLFPDKTADLNLEQAPWDRMMEWKYRILPTSPISEGYLSAMKVKLLAAKEIKITTDGIQAVMEEEPNHPAEDGSSLPEARRF